MVTYADAHVILYFDYPLEQGLRQTALTVITQTLLCILIIH